MKICADCGKELEKGVDTCTCIAELDNQIIKNPVLELVQQIVRTKLFLFAIIAFTVAVVCGFVVDWMTWAEDSYNLIDTDMWHYLLSVITNTISHIGINGGNSMLFLGMILFPVDGAALVSIILSVILVVGMWVIYFTINDCVNYKINPLGFKMVEIVIIIFAIFTCFNMISNFGTLSMGILLFVAGIFEQGFVVFKAINSEILLLGFVFLISLLWQIAVALVYSNMYGLVNSIRTSVEKRTITTMRSIWVIIVLSIGFLSIVLNIVSSFVISEYPSILLISNIISASATILFGFFLLFVRDRINSFVENHRSV